MEFTQKFAGIPILAWIPLLPLIGATLNLTIGRRLSRSAVHTIAIASVAASCGLSIYLVFFPLWNEVKTADPLNISHIEQTVYTWIEVGSFKVPLAFRLDTLSSVMILIVTFVGSLIHIYSTGYMAHEPRYAAYFGYLNLFTGAMLVLVLGANMPVMFIGWEGVGLCSFLLIGFWFERDDYAYAGRKAFVVNRIGDFCFLLGMFLLFWATKDMTAEALATATTSKLTALDGGNLTYAKTELTRMIGERGSLDFANLSQVGFGKTYVDNFWGSERLAAAAGILLFIGACGKSAQLPLFTWLPDAMAGPTPVSALIHAATMVTAGVYMVCRMSFLYSASTTAMIVVATVGLLTALSAAFMAFAQTDLKKVLAYSTVSQLGFMFVAAGTGNWTAAIFHLGTHAFFKACLFLGAGSVMHGMEHGGSSRLLAGDIMRMGGLRKHMPITHITFLVSCLAIAGIFPFAGFFSKDEILGGAWSVNPPGWPGWYGEVLWGGLLLGALGTAFYMFRLYFLVFGGNERSEEAKKAHESPASMTAPLVVLAVLATLAGWIGLPHLSWKLPDFLHAFQTWLSRSVVPNFYDPQHGNPPITGHPSDTTIIALALVALAIAGLGIGLAAMFYRRGPTPTVEKLVQDEMFEPFYRASKAKLWFDEVYDLIIVRPFKLLARGLYEIVDRFIIDTIAVSGTAVVVSLFGRVSRWFQNGQVQRYLAGLVVGAAAVFLVTDCKQTQTFEYERIGDVVELRANVGAGVVGNTSRMRWDLNGDGITDRGVDGNPLEGPKVTARASDIGSEVTLIIEDPVTRKTVKVSRTVELVKLPEPEPQPEGK